MTEFRIVRIDIGPEAVMAVLPDVDTAEQYIRDLWQYREDVGVLTPSFEHQQHFYRIERWDDGESEFTTQWRIDYDSGDMLEVT